MRTQIPGKQILDAGVDTPDIKDGAVTDSKLSTTGVASGSYTKVNVNEKGRVVQGENPTTLAGYGITDAISKNDENTIITVDQESDRPGSRQLTTSPSITKTDGGPLSTLNLSVADNVVLPGTGSATLPSGTTAQQPAATAGKIRFNTTTGYPEAAQADVWKRFVLDDDARFVQPYVVSVNKDPVAGAFSSIAEAVASITVQPGELYLVEVGPGRYVEPEIVIPAGVHVSGYTEYAVIVEPQGTDHPLFTMVEGSTLALVRIENVSGPGQYAFKLHNVGGENGIILHKIALYNSENGWDIQATTADSTVYLEYCDITTSGGAGLRVESANGFSAYVNAENFYIYPDGESPANADTGIFLTGTGTYLNMHSFGLEGEGGGTTHGDAVHVQDGARLDAKGGSIFGWNVGCHLENTGAGQMANFIGVAMHDNTEWDLLAEHPQAVGVLAGTARRSKISAALSPNFTSAFADVEDNAFVQTGDFYMGKDQGTLTNVTDLIIETPPLGLLSGGVLTASGLNITVSAGYGYLRKDGEVTQVTWPDTVVALTPGTSPYVFVNKNGVIQTALAEPSNLTNIIIGRAAANATAVYSVGPLSVNIANHGNKIETYLRRAVGTVYVSGSIVTENATTPRALDVTAGTWMYGTQERNPSASVAGPFLDIYRTGGVLTFVTKTQVPNDTIDDGTNLVAMTPGYYTKHSLYQASEGIYQQRSLAHGQFEYATLDEARAAPLPQPRIPPDSSPLIASIITQQGNPNIVEIDDLRPLFFRTTSNGTAGSTDHGDLTGLGDDDHPQYMLATGARPMLGDLNFGGNDLIDVGLFNGLDITAHASRHQPNGVDPLQTGPGVTLTPSTTNSTGISNNLARADHTHVISGFQPLSAELTSLSEVATTGVLVHVEPNSWEVRELTGSSNISITNGDGVAANPTFNLTALGTPGTYQSVTVDAFGRVSAGTTTVPWTSITDQPSTAAGYGITDVQPLDPDLTALSSMGTTGFCIRTGDGTAVTRSFVLPAAGLTLTNPDGLLGAPTFALANDLAAIEGLASTGIPVRTGTDTWVTRSLTAPASGFTITNPAGLAGNITFALNNDLLGLENLATFGFATRTANNTWVTRSITSTTLSLTNGDGIAGNVALELPAVGTAGTYKSVTTDAYGRVTAGTNPTTLAGFGITDAVNTAQLGASNGVATLDAGGKLSTSQIPLIAITDTFVVASQAAMLALTAEVGDVAVRSDLNKSFILRATPASTLANWQELLTPTDAVLSVNGQTGAVTVPAGTVTSVAAQAPAAGFTVTGTPVTSAGTLVFALADDLAAVEGLGTIGFAVRTAANTWATRTFAAGTGITLSNTNGVAGNITIGTALSLGELTNVTLTTPASGNVLAYNGTAWVNAAQAPSAASAVLSTWTLLSGTRYYADFAHNLGTNNIVLTIYDTADNSIVTADNVTLTTTNVARITVIGNSRTLRVVAVANGNTINTAALAGSTITVAKDGVNVTAAASKINFTGPGVGVTDAGGGVSNVVFGARFTFFAASLDTPTSADWAVNALAPSVADPSFSSLTVRQFSNTTEQGVGFLLSVPAGATTATFRVKGRATTAPAGASVVGLRLYGRLIPNNSAVGAWSTARELGELAIPTNAFFQYGTFTIPLATLGLTAGNMYQIELTRKVAGTTGANLPNNFLLAEVTVEVA